MKNFLLFIASLLFSISGFSQLTEGFEGATFPPTNWAVFDNGVNAAPAVNWVTNATANILVDPASVKAAYMNRPGNIGINNTARDFLATPAVTILPNTQLKFFTRTLLSTPQTTVYQVRIKLVSAGAQNDPVGYTTIATYTDANLVAFYNVYEQKIIPIPPTYNGQSVYVAFVCELTQTGTASIGNRWLVDDVGLNQQCSTPVDTSLTVAPIFATSATLGWTATTGTASYDVENILSTATFTGVPTSNSTTSSFVQTGLLPITCYKFKIRANCGNGNFGPWSLAEKTYCTTAAPPACGGNFLDNGGTAVYLNNSNSTVTIPPATAGEKVTVTFISFETETNWDALYVYDGPDTTFPLRSSGYGPGNVPGGVAGGYWGTTIPGPFTSTCPTGQLTFVFRSDSLGQRAGWIANVTCASPPTCQQPTVLLVNTITATSAQLSWTSPGTATSWEVLVQAASAPAPLPSAIGWTSTNTPNYLAQGLSANTNYAYYVRGNCGATAGVSLWSGPKAFTTLATCPPPTISTTPNTVVTTTTTATISFTETGTATTWHLFAIPCGGPAPTASSTGFTVVTTNPGTITGLLPSTCYNYYVRSACAANDVSIWVGPQTKNTAIAPLTCGDNFYDNGGLGGGNNTGDPNNYTNNSNDTIKICPTPGNVVTVTFTYFNTEDTFDGLYVFNGDSISAPIIASSNPAGAPFGPLNTAGAYWGNTIPGPFTSTSADGCLTFLFKSDASINKGGWVANVTCAPAPTCAKPSSITITNATQTSATIGWTQLPNPNATIANAWEVLVLPLGSPVPTGSGIPSSNPYPAAGLTPGTAYVFYVRAICSGTATSTWAAFNFGTLPSNDECSNAQFAVVNQNLNCVQTTPGTIIGATGSTPATTCLGASNDDVWFTFTATTTTHVISFNNVLPATALNYAIFQGNNCGALTQVGCNSGANLVAGTIYYLRVYSASALPQFTNFNLCIGTLPCTEAPAFCTGQTVTYPNATNVPSLGPIGCLFSSPNPAFFFLQVNQAGPLSYLISQVSNTGTAIDVDYVAWGPFTNLTTACSGVPGNPLPGLSPPLTPAQGCAGTLHACSFSFNSTEIMCIPNAQLCEVYVVMITNYANLPGTVTFSQTNAGGGTTACFPLNSFNYPNLNYCTTDPNPSPILAPSASNGTYSATPPGLDINPITGVITLISSLPGTYIVTSTTLTSTSGACAASIPNIITTRTVVITAPANGAISYSPAVFCQSLITPQVVTRLGSTNGNYSATPVGLSINPSTGAILPINSTAGIYNVVYTVPATGGCPAFIAAPFQVEVLASPIIAQPANQTVCTCYTLPALTVGNYYSQANGAGAVIPAGTQICTNQTVYIFSTNGTCPSEKSFTINSTGTLPAVTNFSYASTQYCQNGINPSPVASSTRTTGGVYSCANAALIINPTTGAIDLTSPVDTYTITYSVAASAANCVTANSSTFLVTILPVITAVTGFSYPQPQYCTNGVNPTPVPSAGFSAGGVYSALPAGLSINPSTGVVNLCGSAAGTYTVKYTAPAGTGLCYSVTSATTTIIVRQSITVQTTISYISPSCTNSPLQSPSISSVGQAVCGTAGGTTIPTTVVGTWSALPVTSPPLNINPVTGQINFANSVPGQYVISYTVVADPTTCLAGSINTFTLDVLPVTIPNADFLYPQPNYCRGGANPFPTLLGGTPTGGQFSCNNSLLQINAATGEINLSSSPADTYTVQYFVPQSSLCSLPNTGFFTVILTDVATIVTQFSYSKAVYCANEGIVIPITANGFTTGGLYSSTAGLNINATTGAINTASTPGSYIVNYDITANPSLCIVATNSQVAVTINANIPSITAFTYATTYCKTDAAALPTKSVGFTNGGTFSSTTGLTINATTGLITPSTSTAGTYVITYSTTLNLTPCLLAGSSAITVKINAQVTPTFTQISPVCKGITVLPTLPTSSNNVPAIIGTWDKLVTATTAGTSTYTFTPSADECATTATMNIIVNELPLYTITGACEDGQYKLDVVPVIAGATYKWTNAAGNVLSNGSNSTQIVNAIGKYNCEVTNTDNCKNIKQFDVTNVICEIQKGISPNGDTKNDFFDLTTLKVKLLEVYSRYGSKVYSLTNYTNEWEGQSDAGNVLPDGTYYYVAELGDGNTKTGWVYINKETK